MLDTCDFGDSHFLFLAEVYVYSASINAFSGSKAFYSWPVSKWFNKWLDFVKKNLENPQLNCSVFLQKKEQ
jgi:hypothetical protein